MRSRLTAGRVVGFLQRALGQLADRSTRQDQRPREPDAAEPAPRRSAPRPPALRPPAPRPPAPRSGSPRDRGRERPVPTDRRAPSAPSSRSRAAAADSELSGTRFEYSPSLDGDADPGEVIWTWVPYEDDPSQGKDRPVVLVGRRGSVLVGVALTSKPHDNEPQFDMGTGPWDREGRPSYAKLERILDVDPAQIRREGAIVPKGRFDDLVAALRAVHRS